MSKVTFYAIKCYFLLIFVHQVYFTQYFVYEVNWALFKERRFTGKLLCWNGPARCLETESNLKTFLNKN